MTRRRRMHPSTRNFLASAVLLSGLVVAIGLSQSELWQGLTIGSFIFIGLPLFIISWMGFGQHLRNQPDSPLPLRIVAILFGIPQALFGLLCITIGLGMVLWVAYNSLVERLPEYSGGFLSLGMSPMFIGFGSYLLLYAFRREGPR